MQKKTIGQKFYTENSIILTNSINKNEISINFQQFLKKIFIKLVLDVKL